MAADKGFKFWAAFFVVKTHLAGRVDSDWVKFDRGAVERKFNVATVGPWNREDIPDTRTFTRHHVINWKILIKKLMKVRKQSDFRKSGENTFFLGKMNLELRIVSLYLPKNKVLRS